MFAQCLASTSQEETIFHSCRLCSGKFNQKPNPDAVTPKLPSCLVGFGKYTFGGKGEKGIFKPPPDGWLLSLKCWMRSSCLWWSPCWADDLSRSAQAVMWKQRCFSLRDSKTCTVPSANKLSSGWESGRVAWVKSMGSREYATPPGLPHTPHPPWHSGPFSTLPTLSLLINDTRQTPLSLWC